MPILFLILPPSKIYNRFFVISKLFFWQRCGRLREMGVSKFIWSESGRKGAYMDFYDKQEDLAAHQSLRNFVRWIIDILMVLILAVMVIRFYGGKTTVSGSSMTPGLASNDVVLLDKLCYTFSAPERLDVISFSVMKEGQRSVYVKRIIGLPGETVQIKGGLVLINGVCPNPDNPLYVCAVSGNASEPITLGVDEYFVLGDNRAGSEDSRFANVGKVSFAQIEGRLWWIFSPFLRMGAVK